MTSGPPLQAPLGYTTHQNKSLKPATGQPVTRSAAGRPTYAEPSIMEKAATLLFAGDDVLKDLSVDDLHSWYRRLAKRVRQEDKDSLAANLMDHWLDAEGTLYTYAPPPPTNRIFNSNLVRDYLRSRVRSVLLTERKGYIGGEAKWVGVLPRIKGMQGFDPWDGTSTIDMKYTGEAVEIPLEVQGRVTFGAATKEDKENVDLLYALHGFSVLNRVKMSVTKRKTEQIYGVQFILWESHVEDRYDWNPMKWITVPNPDYNNAFGIPKPLCKDKERVTVFHSNAKRLEAASKAKPFDFKSSVWTPGTDVSINGPAVVDASRELI